MWQGHVAPFGGKDSSGLLQEGSWAWVIFKEPLPKRTSWSGQVTLEEGTMVGDQPAGLPVSRRNPPPQVRDPQRQGLPHPPEGPQHQVQGTIQGTFLALASPRLCWSWVWGRPSRA